MRPVRESQPMSVTVGAAVETTDWPPPSLPSLLICFCLLEVTETKKTGSVDCL